MSATHEDSRDWRKQAAAFGVTLFVSGLVIRYLFDQSIVATGGPEERAMGFLFRSWLYLGAQYAIAYHAVRWLVDDPRTKRALILGCTRASALLAVGVFLFVSGAG
jgi:hypothetical protein